MYIQVTIGFFDIMVLLASGHSLRHWNALIAFSYLLSNVNGAALIFPFDHLCTSFCNNRTINLLTVYSWNLNGVIKECFLNLLEGFHTFCLGITLKMPVQFSLKKLWAITPEGYIAYFHTFSENVYVLFPTNKEKQRKFWTLRWTWE